MRANENTETGGEISRSPTYCIDAAFSADLSGCSGIAAIRGCVQGHKELQGSPLLGTPWNGCRAGSKACASHGPT
ncbi:hypothetical protein PT974_11270 [Cladobotryum mycophilum]|uniref:Uncharacterized protein n=1 Tax=Cladobotryum mycophilum TaxID=491253 RepID=A0ABR0S5N5_9HYPO